MNTIHTSQLPPNPTENEKRRLIVQTLQVSLALDVARHTFAKFADTITCPPKQLTTTFIKDFAVLQI